VKYALGLEARKPVRPEDLPAPRISEGKLELSYERPADAKDVRYLVEVSDNLSEWYSGDEYTEEEVSAQGDTERVTVRDRIPVTEAGIRFMRLRVERR